VPKSDLWLYDSEFLTEEFVTAKDFDYSIISQHSLQCIDNSLTDNYNISSK